MSQSRIEKGSALRSEDRSFRRVNDQTRTARCETSVAYR